MNGEIHTGCSQTYIKLILLHKFYIKAEIYTVVFDLFKESDKFS